MLLPGWQGAQIAIGPAHPSPTHTVAMAVSPADASFQAAVFDQCLFYLLLPIGPTEAIMVASARAVGKCPMTTSKLKPRVQQRLGLVNLELKMRAENLGEWRSVSSLKQSRELEKKLKENE